MITDPIANMFSAINNTNKAGKHFVYVPLSKIKLNILKILKFEGFIDSYRVNKEKRQITIQLRYVKREPVLTKIKRISKPGLRVYAPVSKLPVVLNNAGIAIMSTPLGVMSNKTARYKNIGGEVIAYVW